MGTCSVYVLVHLSVKLDLGSRCGDVADDSGVARPILPLHPTRSWGFKLCNVGFWGGLLGSGRIRGIKLLVGGCFVAAGGSGGYGSQGSVTLVSTVLVSAWFQCRGPRRSRLDVICPITRPATWQVCCSLLPSNAPVFSFVLAPWGLMDTMLETLRIFYFKLCLTGGKLFLAGNNLGDDVLL